MVVISELYLRNCGISYEGLHQSFSSHSCVLKTYWAHSCTWLGHESSIFRPRSIHIAWLSATCECACLATWLLLYKHSNMPLEGLVTLSWHAQVEWIQTLQHTFHTYNMKMVPQNKDHHDCIKVFVFIVALSWKEESTEDSKPLGTQCEETRCRRSLHIVIFRYFSFHIVDVPLMSSITFWSLASNGNMSATPFCKIFRTSTLNHISRMSRKWNLCFPSKPLILPTATFCLTAWGFMRNTLSLHRYCKEATD